MPTYLYPIFKWLWLSHSVRRYERDESGMVQVVFATKAFKGFARCYIVQKCFYGHSQKYVPNALSQKPKRYVVDRYNKKERLRDR
jgi:hypothetical protein